jgi:hypothetical protein
MLDIGMGDSYYLPVERIYSLMASDFSCEDQLSHQFKKAVYHAGGDREMICALRFAGSNRQRFAIFIDPLPKLGMR